MAGIVYACIRYVKEGRSAGSRSVRTCSPWTSELVEIASLVDLDQRCVWHPYGAMPAPSDRVVLYTIVHPRTACTMRLTSEGVVSDPRDLSAGPVGAKGDIRVR